jgi:hypothetical protein
VVGARRPRGRGGRPCARARETGREIVGRFDEAFELGQQLLASLRGGWLEALATDVGVERKLAL